MKQCPACGIANADAAQVCASCGAGLQNVAPMPPPARGGVHWIVWVLAAALGLAVLGIAGMAFLLFTYDSSGEPVAQPVATSTAEPTQTAQAATVAPQAIAPPPPAPGAPQSPAPQSTVDVTYESGESPTFVVGAFTEGGVDYVVVDWVQLLDDPDWGWDVKNENPKLRTFIVPPSAYLAEADPGTAAEYSISFAELKAATDRGEYDPNNYRIFEMVVDDGEILSLVEWWHP